MSDIIPDVLLITYKAADSWTDVGETKTFRRNHKIQSLVHHPLKWHHVWFDLSLGNSVLKPSVKKSFYQGIFGSRWVKRRKETERTLKGLLEKVRNGSSQTTKEATAVVCEYKVSQLQKFPDLLVRLTTKDLVFPSKRSTCVECINILPFYPSTDCNIS